MSVYVDKLMPCVVNRVWRWPEACHLFADTIEELHVFADQIGLRRSWFQHKLGGMPHYDLNGTRRTLAVINGAQEADACKTVEYIRKWRQLQEAR